MSKCQLRSFSSDQPKQLVAYVLDMCEQESAIKKMYSFSHSFSHSFQSFSNSFSHSLILSAEFVTTLVVTVWVLFV